MFGSKNLYSFDDCRADHCSDSIDRRRLARLFLQAENRQGLRAGLAEHSCIRRRTASGTIYRWEFEKRGEAVAIDVPGQLTLDEEQLMLTAPSPMKGFGLSFRRHDRRQRSGLASCFLSLKTGRRYIRVFASIIRAAANLSAATRLDRFDPTAGEVSFTLPARRQKAPAWVGSGRAALRR